MAVDLDPQMVAQSLMAPARSPNNNSDVYKRYPEIWNFIQQHPVQGAYPGGYRMHLPPQNFMLPNEREWGWKTPIT